MRGIGNLHPNDLPVVPADTVNTLLIANSSGQAMDWPANTQIVRLTGHTTAGAALNFYVNLFSTSAGVPSSGSSAASSGVNHPVNGQQMFQLPSSTGFSVASLSSGYVMVECWKRGG